MISPLGVHAWSGSGTETWEPLEFPLLLCSTCKAQFDSALGRARSLRTLEVAPSWLMATLLIGFFIMLPAVSLITAAVQRNPESISFALGILFFLFILWVKGLVRPHHFRFRHQGDDRRIADWLEGIKWVPELVSTEAEIDLRFGKAETIESHIGA